MVVLENPSPEALSAPGWRWRLRPVSGRVSPLRPAGQGVLSLHQRAALLSATFGG